MEFWTIPEPGTGVANDFYFSREEAQAALEDARRRDWWHPEDAAALAVQYVERIELDDLTASEN